MKVQSYWERALAGRTSRRRLLATTGGVSAAAALLAACGGGDSSKGSKGGDTSGLVAKQVDETKTAKQGGTYKSFLARDVQGLEPMFTSSPTNNPTRIAYARMTTVKPGILQASTGEIIGDLAESWELSADKLQVTFKLNQNAHFAPIAPVNGRSVDAQDIVFSWNRFVQVGSTASDLANSINPAAPITSITAPDNKTIVMKLAEPQSAVLGLGRTGEGGFNIVPKEAEGQIDLRRTQLGAGPYYLGEYSPSTRFIYKRNPGYHAQPRPYVDVLEMPIITEYAAGLAQFRAGAVYQYAVRAEDVIPTKQAVSEILMVQTPVVVDTSKAFFGMKPSPADKTPFRDVRVRQAFSMSWDRDLYIDTVYNVTKFREQGVPVDTRWNTAVRADDFSGWWVDPKSKDFGPNAMYYQHDIAEAKKLLTAAGYANGLDVESYWVTGVEYGTDFAPHVQIIIGFAQDAGFRIKTTPVNFNTDWRGKYADVQGNFEGLSFRVSAAGQPDPGEKLFAEYNSKGGILFTGFDPDGKGSLAGDPALDDLTIKMRREFDLAKRQALAKEFQQYEAKMQYFPRFPGGASGFGLTWPIIRNFGVYQGLIPLFVTEWVDETKAPLKKA